MSYSQLAFTTPPDAPGWQRWLVFSPLARLVFFTALVWLFIVIGDRLIGWSGWYAPHAPALRRAVCEVVYRALPALFAYLLLTRLIEQRRADELALRRLPAYLIAGIVGGALLFSAVYGVLWLLGSYQIIGTNPHADWLPALLTAGVGAGVGEEIITRGALFRIVEEGLGTWWALAISAIFFGGAHMFNPDVTLWSIAAIGIEAGLMFGMLYHVTRSLWPCIGLHLAWNFTQGTVFGVAVSGTRPDGWLVSAHSGPDWLSGGTFGAEASVIALLACSLLTASLLVIALRRGSIVPPFWRRHRRDQVALAQR